MLSLPTIVERPAQDYVGIRERVPMDAIAVMVDRNFPALFEWVEANGVTPVGAAFLKYNVIDMKGLLEIECGVAVEAPAAADGVVGVGTLPAGRYATITHTGPYDALLEVNAVLIGWARQKGIEWDARETEAGDSFACRLEIYETDPASEPDPAKWVTHVIIKIAD